MTHGTGHLGRVPVIVNPAASGGGGGRLLPGLEERLREKGVEFEVRRTVGPGHGAELGRQLAREGAPAALVVGGDGTIHEVANGLLAEGGEAVSTALAVVPLGTGNDFYRMVGAPSDPESALDVLLSGVVRRFDVGHVTWEGGSSYFVNLLGVGIDVEVLRRRAAFKRLTGLAQYLAALPQALFSYRSRSMRVTTEEGEVLEGPITLAAVTVGPSVGGGFLLSPGATPDDGLLDLLFVERIGLLKVARYLPRVVRGTHGSEDEIHMRQLRSVRIESSDGDEFMFDMDGELGPAATSWLEARLVPAALPVLTRPASGGGAG